MGVSFAKPIVLCGEAWGENEDKLRVPFVGTSGIELLRMLAEAEVITFTSADFDYINRYYRDYDPRHIDCIWHLHPELYRTNVFNLRPPGNKIEAVCGGKAEGIKGYPALLKGKFVRKEFLPHLERLRDELVDLDPNLIVCLGNTPLWALSGRVGISKLRGTTSLSTHCVTGFKLLGTYHPAAVLRQWELRPTTVMDLAKAARERGFAEVRRPKREIWIEPTLEDIDEFTATKIRGCKILSVDIETAGSRVTCIGFSPHHGLAIVIPFDDHRRKGRSYWLTRIDEERAWCLVRGILEDRGIPKVFQNGLYDIAFLWRAYGIKTFGAEHDTMLCHHALQPESLKGLGFLGSIYSAEGSWKQERRTATIKADE